MGKNAADHLGMIEETGTESPTPAPITPAHAAHGRERTLLTEVVGDAPGILITLFCLLLGFGLVVVGVVTLHELPSWISALYVLLGLVVLGAYAFFLRYVRRWYQRTNLAEAAAYTRWQTWLRERYGLQLSDTQNDELVNYRDYKAQPTQGVIWGKTAAMRNGQATTLRLVGDDEDGYHLELREADGFAPLPIRA